MTILIYTDPHLGLRRQANTTNTSQARWRQTMYETVIRRLQERKESLAVCVGDLFDTYGNDERTIIQGWDLLRQTAVTLAGNHDVSQVADRVGSLELLQSMLPDPRAIVRADFQEKGYEYRHLEGHDCFFVPHVVAQELFDMSLDEAEEEAADCEGHKVLFLHCNYDNEFAEDDDSSLNLSRARAKSLLKVFDRIILGHEHNGREDFRGRLVVMGNTFPAGFGDISDKRVAVLHEDGSLSFETIWSAEENFLECGVDEIPESTEVQFLRVTGTVKASQIGEVSRRATKLWKTSPSLLALKLAVELESGSAISGEEAMGNAIERLPEIISRELEGTDMWDIWKEVVNDHAPETA